MVGVGRHRNLVGVESSWVWKEGEMVDHAHRLKELIDSIKTAVTVRAQNQFNLLLAAMQHGNGVAGDFVTCLSDLFAHMMVSLRKNEEGLRCFRRGDGFLTAIQELTKICNVRGHSILETYLQCRNVNGLVQSITAGALHLGEREVQLAHEMASVIGLCEDYKQLVIAKCREERHGEDDYSRALFQFDAFSPVVEELATQYTTLEKCLLSEHVKAAMSADTYVPDAKISSMVGEVFGAIQDSSTRASSTFKKEVLLEILHHVSQILSHEYRETLQRRRRELNFGTALSKETGVEASAMLGLNNCDTSAKYLEMIMHDIQYGYNQVLTEVSDAEKVLEELWQTVEAFRDDARTDLKQLAQAIIPGLHSLYDTVIATSYEDLRADVERVKDYRDESDTWVQKLFVLLDAHVVWLHPFVTKDNFEYLTKLVTDDLVNNLGPIIIEKRFNGTLQWGRRDL